MDEEVRAKSLSQVFADLYFVFLLLNGTAFINYTVRRLIKQLPLPRSYGVLDSGEK